MAKPENEDIPEGEMYWDKVKLEWRRKRGRRKRSHGPWSGAEKRMRATFQGLMNEMHWMDGELADLMSRDLTGVIATYRIVARKFSYENVGEVGPGDWEAIREELGIPQPDDGDDDDIYKDLS